MGNKQLVFTGRELLRVLQGLGFEVIRIKGSHHRLKHPDGRMTTIPVHGNDDLPKGLIRKIIKEDVRMEPDVFESLTNNKR